MLAVIYPTFWEWKNWLVLVGWTVWKNGNTSNCKLLLANLNEYLALSSGAVPVCYCLCRVVGSKKKLPFFVSDSPKIYENLYLSFFFHHHVISKYFQSEKINNVSNSINVTTYKTIHEALDRASQGRTCIILQLIGLNSTVNDVDEILIFNKRTN